MQALIDKLAANRRVLLGLLSGEDETILAVAVGDADLAVGDTLAHMLACEAELIWLLEAAAMSPTLPVFTESQYKVELARWGNAPLPDLTSALRQRGERCRRLLREVPDSALSLQWRSWAQHQAFSLAEVCHDYASHDAEHTDEVCQALSRHASRQ